MSSSNYSIMCRVSMCKKDTTVELLLLLTHFFFQDKGEAAQKSSSVFELWHCSQGVLGRVYEVLYSTFSLP